MCFAEREGKIERERKERRRMTTCLLHISAHQRSYSTELLMPSKQDKNTQESVSDIMLYILSLAITPCVLLLRTSRPTY